MTPLLLTPNIVQSVVASTHVPSGISPAVYDVLFWIAAAACLVAQYFIVRAVWKVIPSVTGSPDVPAPRRAQEIMWVLLPVILLTGAFIGAWRTLHPSVSLTANPSTSRSAPGVPAPRA